MYFLLHSLVVNTMPIDFSYVYRPPIPSIPLSQKPVSNNGLVMYSSSQIDMSAPTRIGPQLNTILPNEMQIKQEPNLNTPVEDQIQVEPLDKLKLPIELCNGEKKTENMYINIITQI